VLDDIVIDANVMLHSENMQEARRIDALALMTLLKMRTTKLCVDEGFDWNEALNRSHIGSEYLRHLVHGTLGSAIVAYLAASARIKIVPRQVPQAISRKISMSIGSAPDRVYARVAFNSQDKHLVSHDFGDIPQSSRNRLRTSIGLQIVDAATALPRL
jgi:hypothetical protein